MDVQETQKGANLTRQLERVNMQSFSMLSHRQPAVKTSVKMSELHT